MMQICIFTRVENIQLKWKIADCCVGIPGASEEQSCCSAAECWGVLQERARGTAVPSWLINTWSHIGFFYDPEQFTAKLLGLKKYIYLISRFSTCYCREPRRCWPDLHCRVFMYLNVNFWVEGKYRLLYLMNRGEGVKKKRENRSLWWVLSSVKDWTAFKHTDINTLDAWRCSVPYG